MGYQTGQRISIFAEADLRSFLGSQWQHVAEVIRGETADYLLNVNEDEYFQHLVERFQVEPLTIHFDQITASFREEMIPAEHFPSFLFNVRAGRSYPKQVIRYHIPYEGTQELLRTKPSSGILWSVEVQLKDGHVCFDIIDFHDDGEKIKKQADEMLAPMRRQLDNVKKEVDRYNDSLPDFVRQLVTGRKDELHKQLRVVESLGVPIRKSDNVPETFRVPKARKKVMPRPSPPEVRTGPVEPTLGDDVYTAILEVIHETGKGLERLPSTYAGKQEEDLRDYLILLLDQNFEGSTTGETFNNSGKTDILVRHEGSNLFVAECLWWEGSSKFTKKIDQLLGYLTWRDSKSALVVFVGRKGFSAVLNQVKTRLQEHPCCVGVIQERDETWIDVEFHLPGDPDRNLKLALLAFHLPR